MLLRQGRGQANTFDTVEQIAKTVESLKVKVAALRKANNYLVRANKVKPRLRIVLEAAGYAEIMAILHLGGYLTGKASAMSYGISDRKWHQGRALLQVARVWGYGRDGWLTDDADEIETALKVAAEKCERNPEILISRLPHSRSLTPLALLKQRRAQRQ